MLASQIYFLRDQAIQKNCFKQWTTFPDPRPSCRRASYVGAHGSLTRPGLPRKVGIIVVEEISIYPPLSPQSSLPTPPNSNLILYFIKLTASFNEGSTASCHHDLVNLPEKNFHILEIQLKKYGSEETWRRHSWSSYFADTVHRPAKFIRNNKFVHFHPLVLVSK